MTIEDLQPLLSWLHQHPHLAGVLTCFIAFIETLAIVGLLVPGIVLMTALGTLVGSGVLPASEIFLWATIGSFAGDSVSFWLGRHYHEKIRVIWPFKHFPKLITNGESFFKLHGGKSVFIGRFFGPLRAIIPLIAGMLNMAPARFLITAIIAGAFWAPGYMLPGILLGAASQQLPPETATRFLLAAMGILLVLWCISWVIKRILGKVIKAIDLFLQRIWTAITNTSYLKFLQVILRDNVAPQSHIQLSLLFFAVLLMGLLAILSINVSHHGLLTALNEPLLHFFRGLRSYSIDRVMVGITLLTELHNMIILLALVFAWLWWRKHHTAAIHWLGCGILTIGSAGLLRILIHYPRPSGLNLSPSGWSFPSGHTTLTIALFGFLAVLISMSTSSCTTRRYTYISALTFSIAIICSRLYLGAHWLTDVVGGILLALICIIITTLSYRRYVTQPILIRGLLAVVILTMGLSWTWNYFYSYNQDLYNYSLDGWSHRIISTESWWEHPEQPKPLYRTDRFGTPIQYINIQWAESSIDKIEETLITQGWQEDHIV